MHPSIQSPATMTADPAAAYKARKEAFVSNLTGSSLTDISLVTAVATVSSCVVYPELENSISSPSRH